ncbi:hypothetical protein XBJ1_0581 [Xenorhabdus bovienii SS-2004]|uniref:Uncharacterized protein n=1 Tax=Xenorhabdus bovienii (strain SS-2004) TaxID=406818 RepID=D3UWF1_XENBS|nr:hypothetical protein XBJ1_0581 [Xenorhabdus bovienii SS-2004]
MIVIAIRLNWSLPAHSLTKYVPVSYSLQNHYIDSIGVPAYTSSSLNPLPVGIFPGYFFTVVPNRTVKGSIIQRVETSHLNWLSK